MTRVDLARLSDVASGIPSGTSFPGSPSNNDVFRRTDLDLIFYFDGTRWLSLQLLEMAWADLVSETGSATAVHMPAPPLAGGSDIWLVDFSVQFLVSGGGSALSGSHKWDVKLRKRPTGNSATDISTVTIDSGSSAAWRNTVNAIGALLNNGTTHFVLDYNLTKTGTPGNLNSLCTVRYRIVAT